MLLRLFCFFLFIGSAAYGQDSIVTARKVSVSGYIKDLQDLTFNKDFSELVTGNLLHNRLNMKWKPSSAFTADAEVRTRLYWGETVRLTPDFSELLRNQNERLNMQHVWIDDESLVLHSNVERLYLDYQGDALNVRIGRQRINWALTTTWNPNDLFNSYNFLDFDYEERPGADAGKIHYTLKNSAGVEAAYAFTGPRGTVAAVKYSFNKWTYDFQFIGGWYKQHPTAGFGWAGSIKDAGFKGEAQYYFPASDSAAHFNLALEADYMFDTGWYVNTGFLLNDQGIIQPVADWSKINLALSPENLMPTKWNFMFSTAKEINPLLTANLGLLYAPGTKLFIVIPSLTYNMATNLDLTLLGQSFFAEINDDFQANDHRFFLRFKWSF